MLFLSCFIHNKVAKELSCQDGFVLPWDFQMSGSIDVLEGTQIEFFKSTLNKESLKFLSGVVLKLGYVL